MRKRSRTNRDAGRTRGAFTLTEAVVTLSVSTILMGALGSAVYIAGFAVPTKTGTMSRVSDSAAALEAMAVDLQYAQAILESTAQAVTVLVADRNNDGAAERIRYSWSGVPGAAVMRQDNGNAAAAVISTAQQFQVSYSTAARTEQVDGVASEDTNEVLLYEYATFDGLREKSMSGSDYVAQYFKPVLPAKATGWKPSRMVMGLRRALLGTARFDIYASDGSGLPAGASLGNTTAVLLAALAPVTLSLGSPPTLRADQAAVIVGRATLGTVYVSASDQGVGLLESTNAGSTWTSKSEGALAQVYGTIIWPRSKITLSQTYAKAITVSVQTGASETAQRIAVPTLNCPELLSQIWQVDFSRDPTAADSNADATSDFRPADNSALSATPVSSGRLQPTEDLAMDPANDYTAPARIELRMKSGSATNGSARFVVDLERTATTAAPVALYLTTDADGTSSLRLFNDANVYPKQSGAVVTNEAPADVTNSSSILPLVAVRGLPRTATDVRLVTDPANNRVALFANQVHQGTFVYQTYTLASPSGRALIGGDAGAEFDSVSIRIE